jgi:hypothetical protein
LTTCLYMLSCANFSFKRVSETTENLTIISFYLLPQILMVLCYVLLYQLLDLMTSESKVEDSQYYANREQR